MKFYKDFDLKEVVEGVKYIEDLPDGKYYYSDYEKKRCVSIKNGKKQGLEIFYNQKGEKISEKYYNNGIRFYEIHFQRKEEKKLEQIKQLERVLKELKESVGEAECKGLCFID